MQTGAGNGAGIELDRALRLRDSCKPLGPGIVDRVLS